MYKNTHKFTLSINSETRKKQIVQTQKRHDSLVFYWFIQAKQFLPHKVQLSHRNKIHGIIKYVKFNTPGRESTK
jgi:hypothetical protein